MWVVVGGQSERKREAREGETDRKGEKETVMGWGMRGGRFV